MRHTYVLAALAAVVVAGAGCEKAKASDDKFNTVLLDEGAAPRYALRYQIPVGTKQSLDMVMDIDMNIPGLVGEMIMPRMIMVTDLEVTKVDSDGSMHMDMVFTDVRVEDRPGSMAGVAGAMQGEIDAMKGMKMSQVLAPNGRVKDMKVDTANLPPQMQEQMKQAEQAVDQMTAILPDQPVGMGARWRVEQTVRQGGIKMNMAATYEVVEISEGHAKIKTQIEMSAPEQTVTQNGISARLDKMVGAGDSVTTLDLQKLVERVAADIDMDMSMSAQGQSINMNMKMGIEILPSGQAPSPPGQISGTP